MQNYWIPLFCDFWQIIRMQSPNAKLLEMLSVLADSKARYDARDHLKLRGLS